MAFHSKNASSMSLSLDGLLDFVYASEFLPNQWK